MQIIDSISWYKTLCNDTCWKFKLGWFSLFDRDIQSSRFTPFQFNECRIFFEKRKKKPRKFPGHPPGTGLLYYVWYLVISPFHCHCDVLFQGNCDRFDFPFICRLLVGNCLGFTNGLGLPFSFKNMKTMKTINVKRRHPLQLKWFIHYYLPRFITYV